MTKETPKPPPEPAPSPSRPWLSTPLVALFFALLTWFLFSRLADPAFTLDAGDAPVHVAHQMKKMMSAGTFSSANPAVGLGGGGPILIGDLTVPLWYLLPDVKSQEAMMAVSVFLAALFFFLFLRDRGYSRCSALAGALALGFSTALLSLAKAGHVGKFLGVAYLSGSLWLMNRTIWKGSWLSAGFAGLFLGWAFAEGRDVAILMLTGIGLFWIRDFVCACRQAGRFLSQTFLRLLLAGLIALIVLWPVAQSLLPKNEQNIPAAAAQDPEQQYIWATSWSLPPSELVKLVCPSYCGWDSWHPTAPYWGEMGRSHGWEKTRQGFRNFTQTNEYIGVSVFILALMAALFYAPRWKENRLAPSADAPPADTLFWLLVIAGSLILAFGFYTPLYRLFYSLPLMSSIRCPVKFMHLVCVGLAILAAQGAYMVETARQADAFARRRVWLTALVASGAVTGLFLLMLISAPGTAPEFLARLRSEGFEAQIPGIQSAMMTGLFRSFILSALVGAAILFGLSRLRAADLAGGLIPCVLLCGLITFDVAAIDKQYVAYNESAGQYRLPEIMTYLKNFPAYRVKFIPHTWGIFNYWNSLLVPYHFIRSTDMPSQSRPNPDLLAFYSAFGRNPGRQWALMGARHIVIPRELEPQIRPLLGSDVKAVRGFDLGQAPDGSFQTVWAKSPSEGRFAVLEYAAALPCVAGFSQAIQMPMDKACALLGDPGFDLSRTLLLDAREEKTLAPLPGAPDPGPMTCELVEYTENRIVARCKSANGGWVMVNDYFEPGWEAAVSGKSAPILRADVVFRAVAVPPGDHEMVMTFRGSTASFWYPAVVFIVLSVWLAGALALKFFRKRPSP